MRMYSVTGANFARTAASDLLELLAPSTAIIQLHRVWIEQRTEFGDAQSEQIVTSLRRVTGSPTPGSGGSTPTPVNLFPAGAAAGATARAGATTALTGGTNVILMTRSWHVQAGFEIVYAPEERPVFSPSTRFLMTLDQTPADSITFDVGCVFAEMG